MCFRWAVANLLNLLWRHRQHLLVLDPASHSLVAPQRAEVGDARRVIKLQARDGFFLKASKYMVRRCYADLFSVLAQSRAGWLDTSPAPDEVCLSFSDESCFQLISYIIGIPQEEEDEMNSGVIFVGSPGIGKTSTSPYFIVRWLMQDPSIRFGWYMDKHQLYLSIRLDQAADRIIVERRIGGPESHRELTSSSKAVLFWDL